MCLILFALVFRRVCLRPILRWLLLVFLTHWLHCQNSPPVTVLRSLSHADQGLWQPETLCHQVDRWTRSVLPAWNPWSDDFFLFKNMFDVNIATYKDLGCKAAVYMACVFVVTFLNTYLSY